MKKFAPFAVIFSALMWTACPNPADDGTKDVVTGITWEAIQVGGEAGARDSASILFNFSADPGALDAENITLSGAIFGALSGTGKNRSLELRLVREEGEATVSIAKEGIAAGPKKVMLYREARAEGSITWMVEATGHDEAGAANESVTQAGGKSTSSFVFTFSAPVENLQAGEINLGINEWHTSSLTHNSDNTVWTLDGEIIRDIATNRWVDLQAVIRHADVNSVCINTTQPKYYLSVCSGWALAERGGTEGSVNSTAIDITFRFPVSGLQTEDVTLTSIAGTGADTRIGAATKGTVTGSGANWSINLTGVEATGTVAVTIRKAGVFSHGTTPEAGVQYPSPARVIVKSALAAIDFTPAEVGGTSATVSSTAITLTFTRAVDSLTASDIVITGNGGSANIGGTPTHNADKTVWTVPVRVGLEGNIKVRIQPRPGMTAAEKIVAVYKKNGVETGELDSGIPILLDDYLANLASPTAASPATVRLNSSVRLADDWGLVDQMARNAAKHIILDLSACPDTSISGRDAQGSPAPSGNDFNIIRNNQYIKGIILPTSLTVIGDYAFDGCDNITRIGNEADKLHIPVGVTQVGTMAFQGVNHIATLVFDSRNGTALSIGISAFAGTGSDTNGPSTSVTTGFSGALVIPANTTFEKNASNASRAFEFRKFFTSLVIEEGCTDIPQMAFQWCQGITEITIPASVTTIRTNAFKRCEGVTKVSILAAPADRGIQKITTFESQSSGTAVNRVRTLYNNGDSGAGHYAGVYTGDTAAVVWSPLP